MRLRGRPFARLLALATTTLLVGCGALGWRFGPGYAATDPDLFAAPPVVEHRGATYVLTWVQGRSPYFFEPRYEVREGRLVFALAATSSSGNLAGRRREMKIEGVDNLHALERGGAYWWEREPEPHGRFVRLRIVETAPASPRPLSDRR